jgi:alpha-L-fucosidase
MTGPQIQRVFHQPATPSSAVRRTNRPRRWLLLVLLTATLTACGGETTVSAPSSEPTLCNDASVTVSREPTDAPAPDGTARVLPAWYDDAKFGIMIHWGVWTIPAWAETTLDPERLGDPNDPLYLLAPPCPPCPGVDNFLRHNPYTEWYENSLAIDGTATQEFHRTTYGADFPYTGFQDEFEKRAANWNAEVWARLFAEARARYVVFVTKHHDGYALWPTEVENPHRANWHWQRDAVGELATAVRERCVRMGVYYSGGIDWSFKAPPIQDVVDLASPAPAGPEYAHYFEDHYRELIERYQPSILWNDITSPAEADLALLFQDFFAAVPDGVVNDRWSTLGAPPPPGGFRTVEYDVPDQIDPEKWETVRGIGRTFGYNRNELPEDYGTPEKYIYMLIDVVSKNGNLLLNVGPMDDGTIPEEQVTILRALGAWNSLYGEAIFGTRPWTRYAGTTDQGIPVRFTQRRDGSTAYAILLGTPSGSRVTLLDFPETPTAVRLVGSDKPIVWDHAQGNLQIDLPAALPAQPAHAFAIELAGP